MFDSDRLQHLLATYGGLAVAVVVGLEGMGIPLPGETILVLAAAYAGRHNGNLFAVIASAVTGAIIGDNIGFFFGRELGSRFLLRYGSYVGITDGRIKLGQYLFQRHGSKVVFFGRFVALLRFMAAFLAGVNRMPWPKFFVANAAGGTLWATTLVMAAYYFGREFRLQGPLGYIGLAAGVIALVVAVRYFRSHEAEMQAEAERALPGPVRV